MKANEFYCLDCSSSRALHFVVEAHFEQWLTTQDVYLKNWLAAHDFTAKSGQVCLVADDKGQFTKAIIGLSSPQDEIAIAKAAAILPPGNYASNVGLTEQQALNWSLAQYCFDRYVDKGEIKVKRLCLSQLQHEKVIALAQAIFLVRDLINTPTNDMSPSDLAEQVENLANSYGAQFNQVVGEDLLAQNFPAIHAVGRASSYAPRLLELSWGNKEHPLVTIVGKGVCFDSGGLDIKPSAGMRLMKKDMGGAAHAIGLSHWIMQRQLPLRLHLLVPAVENAISANAYRPGDIIATRKGLSVEIGNTDAEGRLILADALTYACEKEPEILLDFATLTGAARVAVGTDIAAMFSNDDDLAQQLQSLGEQTKDYVWRLPLHQGYLEMIKPDVADLSNSAATGYAGAITAALFLQQFIEPKTRWCHFDIMAWNTASKPGKPKGGEALSLQAVAAYLDPAS